MDIDTCVGIFSGAILEALVDSKSKHRRNADPKPQIPAGIQNEIRLKTQLRKRWQVTRDPALKAEVNRLQRSVTRHLNEWRNDRWCTTLESVNLENQSLSRMTKRVMRNPTTSPLDQPGRNRSLRL